MSYLLWTLLLIVLVPSAVLGLALAAGLGLARWLGIPEFRLFADGAPEHRSKRFIVRSASALVAFITCFLLGFASVERIGTYRPSMAVNVHPGPARDAGVRDGDRIVAVDGKPCDSFEALRADIQSSSAIRKLTIERDGQRRELFVTPRDRRIGVEQRIQREPASAGEAASVALALAFAPLKQFRLVGEKSALIGPVGIVKSIEGGPQDRFGASLYLAAIMAAYTWLGIVALHVFDALLLAARRWNDPRRRRAA